MEEENNQLQEIKQEIEEEQKEKDKDREEELKKVIEKIGFRCFGAIKNSDKFIYIDGVKY